MVVRAIRVGDLDENVTVLPIVSELFEPLEICRARDSLLQKVILDDFFSMDIKYD